MARYGLMLRQNEVNRLRIISKSLLTPKGIIKDPEPQPSLRLGPNLREFVKTSVILTPGALLVGCELQFVLHFRGIRGIRGGAQKLIFEQ